MSSRLLSKKMQLEFDRLRYSYEAIGEVRSPLMQQYLLNRIASSHGLSQSECRRLFKIWQAEVEQEEIEGASHG